MNREDESARLEREAILADLGVLAATGITTTTLEIVMRVIRSRRHAIAPPVHPDTLRLDWVLAQGYYTGFNNIARPLGRDEIDAAMGVDLNELAKVEG